MFISMDVDKLRGLAARLLKLVAFETLLIIVLMIALVAR